MMTDISTIIWKEWQELARQRGMMRGGLIGMLIFVGVFGIFLPIQFGVELVNSPLQLMIWGWVPFLLISTVISDAFAGERERHTLETLLASRLSDRAILFGKIAAAISYGWGLAMLCMLLGLVTINIAYGEGKLLLYPLDIFVGIVGISLLISGLAAGLGVLISLRAATVRQAQQTFSIIFMLIFVPFFFIPYLPKSWQAQLAQFLMGAEANFGAIVIAAVLVLLIVDIALFVASMVRFKRARLILD